MVGLAGLQKTCLGLFPFRKVSTSSFQTCLAGLAELGKLKTATFLGSESNVRPLRPLPAGPVRPSGPCCLGVAEAPFLSLESSKMATFLVGSESNVRQQGPLPAGPVRPSGPCCLGVAEAPLLSLECWKTATFQKATLGSRGRCRQALSVLQGPAVWAWRRRRF